MKKIILIFSLIIVLFPSLVGATIYTGTNTVTFTLTESQDVIAWAKGTADNIAVQTPQNVILELDGSTVDSINAGAGGMSSTGKLPYSLIHADNLSAGSHTYEQSGNAGTNDMVLIVEVLDYSTSGGGGGGGGSIDGNAIAWTCVTTATTTQDCAVTATSTPAGSSYNGPNFQEWLFVAGIFLFILAFNSWGNLFKPVAKIIK